MQAPPAACCGDMRARITMRIACASLHARMHAAVGWWHPHLQARTMHHRACAVGTWVRGCGCPRGGGWRWPTVLLRLITPQVTHLQNEDMRNKKKYDGTFAYARDKRRQVGGGGWGLGDGAACAQQRRGLRADPGCMRIAWPQQPHAHVACTCKVTTTTTQPHPPHTALLVTRSILLTVLNVAGRAKPKGAGAAPCPRPPAFPLAGRPGGALLGVVGRGRARRGRVRDAPRLDHHRGCQEVRARHLQRVQGEALAGAGGGGHFPGTNVNKRMPRGEGVVFTDVKNEQS